MSDQRILMQMLEESGALRRGHFLLSSGLHSEAYVQCALLLEDPVRARKVGGDLAELLRQFHPDSVLSPALGGVIIGHEVAAGLGVPFRFTERKGEEMGLRRGFTLRQGERVVIVEDVVTTGRSTLETAALATARGARVVAVGAIIDRTAGRAPFDVPFRAADEARPALLHPPGLPGLPLRRHSGGEARQPARGRGSAGDGGGGGAGFVKIVTSQGLVDGARPAASKPSLPQPLSPSLPPVRRERGEQLVLKRQESPLFFFGQTSPSSPGGPGGRLGEEGRGDEGQGAPRDAPPLNPLLHVLHHERGHDGSGNGRAGEDGSVQGVDGDDVHLVRPDWTAPASLDVVDIGDL